MYAPSRVEEVRELKLLLEPVERLQHYHPRLVAGSRRCAALGAIKSQGGAQCSFVLASQPCALAKPAPGAACTLGGDVAADGGSRKPPPLARRSARADTGPTRAVALERVGVRGAVDGKGERLKLCDAEFELKLANLKLAVHLDGKRPRVSLRRWRPVKRRRHVSAHRERSQYRLLVLSSLVWDGCA